MEIVTLKNRNCHLNIKVQSWELSPDLSCTVTTIGIVTLIIYSNSQQSCYVNGQNNKTNLPQLYSEFVVVSLDLMITSSSGSLFVITVAVYLSVCITSVTSSSIRNDCL